MCFSECLTALRQRGFKISESQLRWALRTEKVRRPRVSSALKFDFTDDDVEALAAHFSRTGASRLSA